LEKKGKLEGERENHQQIRSLFKDLEKDQGYFNIETFGKKLINKITGFFFKCF
jgi:Ca2+-binding EF-hand superfamily protein